MLLVHLPIQWVLFWKVIPKINNPMIMNGRMGSKAYSLYSGCRTPPLLLVIRVTTMSPTIPPDWNETDEYLMYWVEGTRWTYPFAEDRTHTETEVGTTSGDGFETVGRRFVKLRCDDSDSDGPSEKGTIVERRDRDGHEPELRREIGRIRNLL
jgi:hypothetical protein